MVGLTDVGQSDDTVSAATAADDDVADAEAGVATNSVEPISDTLPNRPARLQKEE